MSSEPLKLKKSIIYGPVNSRRLGSSLGVNLLSHTYKACPFNCAYCQYGFTGARGHIVSTDGQDMPKVAEVVATARSALEEYPSISYITFSGNGEPTLHPDFEIIVEELKGLKNKVNPEIKLAILSNSALVHKNEVRRGLANLDCRFMKLDCGDDETFNRFNRPHKDIALDMIVNGLKKLDDIIIQSLFAGGKIGNYNDYSIDKWIKKIGEIRPLECHIYSLDRPSADRRLVKIDRDGMMKIKRRTEGRVGVAVSVF